MSKYWLGKHLSPEHRRKIALSKMGNKCALGNKNKGFLGRHHSEETKKKMSVSHLKRYEASDGYWKGKVLSTEHRRKIGEGVRKYFRENPESNPSSKEIGVSIPQQELFAFIKEEISDAELNLAIRTRRGIRFADVGIVSLRLDVEFDGDGYWHSPASDYERDVELLEVGWKTARITYELLERIRSFGFVATLNELPVTICDTSQGFGGAPS